MHSGHSNSNELVWEPQSDFTMESDLTGLPIMDREEEEFGHGHFTHQHHHRHMSQDTNNGESDLMATPGSSSSNLPQAHTGPPRRHPGMMLASMHSNVVPGAIPSSSNAGGDGTRVSNLALTSSSVTDITQASSLAGTSDTTCKHMSSSSTLSTTSSGGAPSGGGGQCPASETTSDSTLVGVTLQGSPNHTTDACGSGSSKTSGGRGDYSSTSGADFGAGAVSPTSGTSSHVETGGVLTHHGHSLIKKTFHKPVYCHHCTEMIWGLLGTGLVCEVCNFLVHEKCSLSITTPCTTLAATLINNPVSHCWSEPGHFKRKFCNVCRKRLDDSLSIRCELCEYHSHVDCQDYVTNDCKDGATYVPERSLEEAKRFFHLWREGNLPSNSKCGHCRRACWSSECLTGYRCEWCGVTAHPGCYRNLAKECTFGVLRDIMLPPYAVCLPRTSISKDNIVGVSRRVHSGPLQVRTVSEEWSSSSESKEDSCHEKKSPKELSEKESAYMDGEYVRCFDGNGSYKRRSCRCLNLNKISTAQQAVEQCLKTFHLNGHPDDYYICEYNDKDGSERRLDDNSSLRNQLKHFSKHPTLVLRHREPKDVFRGKLKVYPGNLLSHNAKTSAKFKEIPITRETTAKEVIILGLRKFGCAHLDVNRFNLVEVCLDRHVTERIIANDELPWNIIQRSKRESLRSLRLTRFYLRSKEDPHGGGVALFVGNLKENLSQRLYERLLLEKLGAQNKWDSIDVIYYENGCLVMTFASGDRAENAYNILKSTLVMDRQLKCVLLPRIFPHLIPEDIHPLLVFVNVKSGGCQGVDLITSFRKLLNPHQVFNLDFGGPLPGLYCFRHLLNYRVLVCGGDGTVGWVLSCLDSTGQDTAACHYPPIAVLPLGTGNDLARVLRWGTGYTASEEPLQILKEVSMAEPVQLDRWTLVVRSEEADKDETKMALQLQSTNTADTNEDNSVLIIMNNYFGIGIDADLSLDFHNARSENPTKFNSRIHNKSVYFKLSLRKMMNRSACKDLHKQIVVEADGKVLDLPPLEGIIVLNIMSWAGGANPWGVERDEHFNKPTHYDGRLEVVGVSGVIHMGQIYSSMRNGIRLAQAEHLKISIKNDIPVQVDGEPFIQPPGQITVLRSALKATMLKKAKRVKRRNTEPAVNHNNAPAAPAGGLSVVPGPSGAPSPVTSPLPQGGSASGASPYGSLPQSKNMSGKNNSKTSVPSKSPLLSSAGHESLDRSRGSPFLAAKKEPSVALHRTEEVQDEDEEGKTSNPSTTATAANTEMSTGERAVHFV